MDDPILDVDDFLERVQNDTDLLFELLDIFINDYQIKRAKLEDAVNGNDYESVEHIAHFLKGYCGNISAKSLNMLFHNLDVKGRSRQLDNTKQDLVQIDQQFED